MSVWVPVVISGLILLAGVIANVALYAFGNGKMKGAQEALASQVSAFTKAVEKLTDAQQSQGLAAADHAARIASMERTTRALEAMQGDFIAMKATFSEQSRQMRDDIAKLMQRAEHT